MNEKKRLKRKLIILQNQYGKDRGKVAWKAWKETQGKKTNG